MFHKETIMRFMLYKTKLGFSLRYFFGFTFQELPQISILRNEFSFILKKKQTRITKLTF